MSRAAENQRLFNQAAQIYAQMGMGVPGFAGKPGGGRRTAHLQNVISQGQQMLNQYRQRQLQNQMRQAQQAARSQLAALNQAGSQPKTLQATLGQAESGVRGRRSRTQLLAQQQGVRATSQLQSGPYTSPGGGQSATPYGSSINLA